MQNLDHAFENVLVSIYKNIFLCKHDYLPRIIKACEETEVHACNIRISIYYDTRVSVRIVNLP